MFKVNFLFLIAALTVPCMLSIKVSRPGNSDEDCAKACTNERDFSCVYYHHDSGVCYLSSEEDRSVSARRTVKNLDKEEQDGLSLVEALEERLKAVENKVLNQQTFLDVQTQQLKKLKSLADKQEENVLSLVEALEERLKAGENKVLNQQEKTFLDDAIDGLHDVQTQLLMKLESLADDKDNLELVKTAKKKVETAIHKLEQLEETFGEMGRKFITALMNDDLKLHIETKGRVWSISGSYLFLIIFIVLATMIIRRLMLGNF